MTLVDARQSLADALNTVDGVTGYRYRPRAIKPGDAWPILPSLELEQSQVWRPTFRVLVALSNDERTAAEWVDTHFEPIVLALRGPAWPESAELIVIETEAGDRVVLDISLKSDP